MSAIPVFDSDAFAHALQAAAATAMNARSVRPLSDCAEALMKQRNALANGLLTVIETIPLSKIFGLATDICQSLEILETNERDNPAIQKLEDSFDALADQLRARQGQHGNLAACQYETEAILDAADDLLHACKNVKTAKNLPAEESVTLDRLLRTMQITSTEMTTQRNRLDLMVKEDAQQIAKLGDIVNDPVRTIFSEKAQQRAEETEGLIKALTDGAQIPVNILRPLKLRAPVAA